MSALSKPHFLPAHVPEALLLLLLLFMPTYWHDFAPLVGWFVTSSPDTPTGEREP